MNRISENDGSGTPDNEPVAPETTTVTEKGA